MEVLAGGVTSLVWPERSMEVLAGGEDIQDSYWGWWIYLMYTGLIIEIFAANGIS